MNMVFSVLIMVLIQLTGRYSPTVQTTGQYAGGAPPVPVNLVATPGTSAVALTWTASAGATSYKVYRGTAPGGETLLASGVATATYSDSTVALGTVYYYQVTAVDSGYESARSNEASAGAPALSDSFTDADATALTAHIMNVGPGWTNANGTFQIQSNKATPNASGFDAVVTDAGKSDCTIEVDYVDTGTAHDNDAGLFFRSDGTYLGYAFWQSSSAGWQLTEVTAGPTYTSRGTFAQALNPGQNYHLKVVLLGQSIQCYVDGTLAITYSSALYQTNTKHGLHSFKGAGYSTTFDNFRVTQ